MSSSTVLGTKRKDVSVAAITYENYSVASQCTARKNCIGCDEKIQMYRDIGEERMGFVNMDGNNLFGGAEWYPSLLVPYDIPKKEDIAFMTCVYLSDSEFDTKTGAMKQLEEYLSERYSKIVVISDEVGVFPNGNMNFFLKNGYRDEGVVFQDEYCNLHLMSKVIS